MRSRPLSFGILLFAVATLGEFAALYYWQKLIAVHFLMATLVLWVGFIVERTTVVVWLRIPARLPDPWGRIMPRSLVLFWVTFAEIVAWVSWWSCSHHAGVLFGALFLFGAIHLIHAYEVAIISRNRFKDSVFNLGTITLSIFEATGGALWLSLTEKGRPGLGALLLLASLLVEHILQVVGQTHKT